MPPSEGRPVRIGIAGMGAAGQSFIPALARHAGFEWTAFAEPVAEVRGRIAQAHRVAAFESIGELLAHPGLDAVYVATPTPLHAEQVQLAAAAGLHVLVEKPMAVTLAQAGQMVDAARRAGVVLLVGHSHSYDLPIRRMRELIASGELGPVRMVNTWCFTDWVERPRRADELDELQGGGVTFRQGAHQFDIIRLLCGGKARSVRAKAFDWKAQRRAIGAHTVFIDFEDGAAATAVYNGYGGLASSALCFDISEWGFREPAAHRPRRSAVSASPAEELKAKQARAAGAIPAAAAPYQPFFGLTVVSCEQGDIRQSPNGLLVHSAGGIREIALASNRSPRDLVLAEFHDAISGNAPAVHDGRWGLATLELCVAALESSRSGRELALQYQVALPAGA
ncbi:MAG: Gfo/Idh/MocA family oxidoreductase [Pseudomonadota bacterium]|nr:Gfo/Idh/MocA family oxidoreductase [Pseudomonadota bacterium]